MALEEAGVKLVAEGESQFISAMDRSEKAVKGFADATDNGAGRVNLAQAAFTGAFTAIAGVAVEAFGRAAQAVGDFVGGAIESAASFEQGMAVLQATTKATPAEMQKVADMAKQLGNDLQLPTVSSQDAGEAILELVKSGLTLDEAMSAVRGTLLLATAAEIEAGEAAHIAAGMLNAFELDASESTRVVNLLAAAAAKGAGEIQDYAIAGQQAGFAFHGAKLGPEEMTAAIQTLIATGLTGSDAGTALKNTIISLQKPTKQSAELMEKLGIDIYDSSGQMKPFNEIVGEVNGGLEGMNDAQRSAALGTIFSIDGMKAMIPILNAGKAAFEDRTKAITDTAAAQELADAKTKGFIGAQAAFQSQMATLQQTIGEKLLPVLTTLFRDTISPAIATVMAMVDAFFAAGGGADQLGKALAPVIAVVESVVLAFQSAGTESSSAFTIIQTVVQSVAGYVQAVLGVLATFIEAHGDSIRGFIQTTWEKVSVIIGKAVELISAILVKVFDFIAQFIEQHGDKIQAVLEAVWNAIKAIVESALAIIESVIKIALAIIQGDWQTVWDEILNLVDVVLKALYDIVKAALDLLKAVVDAALTFLEELFRDAWEKIKKKAEEDWNALKAQIQGALNDISKAAEKVVKDIIGFFESLPSRLGQLGSDAMAAMAANIEAGLAPIRAAIQSVLDFFNSIRGLGQPGGSGASSYTGSAYTGATATTDQIYSNAKTLSGSSSSYTRNYNLALNTMQSSSGVVSDFAIMEALAA